MTGHLAAWRSPCRLQAGCKNAFYIKLQYRSKYRMHEKKERKSCPGHRQPGSWEIMDTIYKSSGPFTFDPGLVFLSNSCPSRVEIPVDTGPLHHKLLVFPCAESACQAFKCPLRAEEFTRLDGACAWAHGREVPLRTDWEKVKESIMGCVLSEKFLPDPCLLGRLTRIPGRIVMENTWGDAFWGVCGSTGENPAREAAGAAA